MKQANKAKPHSYSPEQLQFIEDRKKMSRVELTAAFNTCFETSLSVSAIKGVCKRNNWRTGRTGLFEKGHVPHPNAHPTGPNKTSFKKGQMPYNWRPIGHERLTKEGYHQRKITDTGNTVSDYVELHRLLWEEHNGPIPPGHVVMFKDGNKDNIVIENLLLISRGELGVMNKKGLINTPADAKEIALLIAKITIKRNSINKERNASC